MSGDGTDRTSKPFPQETTYSHDYRALEILSATPSGFSVRMRATGLCATGM